MLDVMRWVERREDNVMLALKEQTNSRAGDSGSEQHQFQPICLRLSKVSVKVT